MATIYIDHLQPGMILDRDVKNINGFLLVPAGTELTEKHLYILRAWGVSEADIRLTSRENSTEPEYEDVDPVRLREAEAELAGLFRHADLSHSAMKELFRLCILRRVRNGSEKC